MKTIGYIIVLLCGLMTKGYSQHMPQYFEAGGTGAVTTLVTDYQALGINPANLGFPQDGRMIHFSFLESGFSWASDAITRKDIWQTFISNNMDGFSLQDQKQAALAFSNAGFIMQSNLNLVSFSFQNELLGGIGLVIRDRISNQVRLNSNLAELIFLGNDAPYFQNLQPTSLKEIFENSKISGSWYREIILGYGRKFMSLAGLELYAGADVKYILGYGDLNIYSDGKDFVARSSITPYMDIHYDNSSPTAMAQSGFQPVGHGMAFDLGATIKYRDIFKAGLAINDLGSINWESENYQAPNIKVDSVASDGFNSYKFVDEIKQLFANDHILQWQGAQSYSTGLPANVRLGGSINPIKWFEVGVDVMAPLNNHAANLDKAIFSAGGYFKIGDVVRLSLGYVDGDIFHRNMPFGLAFGFRHWQYGFATGDLLTFFRQENPTLSFTSGFLRFKFGPA
ncbi:MAG: DUF5723 family protein [Bacteroidota bacterium]